MGYNLNVWLKALKNILILAILTWMPNISYPGVWQNLGLSFKLLELFRASKEP